jgi:protein TonB
MLVAIMFLFLAQAAPPSSVRQPPSPTIAEPPMTSIVPSPGWIRKPTGYDIFRVYPEAAKRMRLNGQATIRCEVTPKGELANCVATEETPANRGFGEAALKLAPRFQMKSMTCADAPATCGTVSIPIRFIITP